jgi:nitroreductase
MDIDAFLDLVRRKGSIRRFKSDPISDTAVEKLIEAARWASSGANTQPWEFIIIRDAETKKEITRLFAEGTKRWRKKDKTFPFADEAAIRTKIEGAPVLIAICADPRFKAAYPKVSDQNSILNVSMGVAIENLLLAATASGLGACWGTVEDEKLNIALRRLLNIPNYLRVMEIISVGYADEAPSHTSRRSLEEVTHREKMDRGKLRTNEEIRHLLSKRKKPNIYSATSK